MHEDCYVPMGPLEDSHPLSLKSLRAELDSLVATCSFEGCSKPKRALGYCIRHYGQQREGKKLQPLKAKLPNGYTEADALAKNTPQGLSPDECWPWMGALFSNGYGVVRLPSGKVTGAHRLSWALANGRDPSSRWEQVRHRCDNRPCVNPRHLQIGSLQDNMADMRDRGRSTRGERSASARLTADQVTEIRRRGASGEPHSSIACDFPVGRRHITAIIQRITWKHL